MLENQKLRWGLIYGFSVSLISLLAIVLLKQTTIKTLPFTITMSLLLGAWTFFTTSKGYGKGSKVESLLSIPFYLFCLEYIL